MLFYLIPILRAHMFVILSWAEARSRSDPCRDYDQPTNRTRFVSLRRSKFGNMFVDAILHIFWS